MLKSGQNGVVVAETIHYLTRKDLQQGYNCSEEDTSSFIHRCLLCTAKTHIFLSDCIE